MKNYTQPGDTLTLVAPSGGVEGGKLYLIGARPVVAVADADAGVEFAGATRGVFRWTTAANANAGVIAYYNLSTHVVTPTSATGLLPVGTFVKAATEDGEAEVMLDGIAAVVVPGG